jgi:obg-like ATPase 1
LNTNIYFTSKPVIYLANIGRDQYIKKQNKFLPKILDWIKAHGGGPMLPYSAAFEKEIVDTAQGDLS